MLEKSEKLQCSQCSIEETTMGSSRRENGESTASLDLYSMSYFSYSPSSNSVFDVLFTSRML